MTQGTFSLNLSSLALLVLEKKLKDCFRGGAGHALIYDPRVTKVTIYNLHDPRYLFTKFELSSITGS